MGWEIYRASIDGEAGPIYLKRCDVTVDRPEKELAEVERWRIQAAESQLPKSAQPDSHQFG
jgi:hypothetical protein